MIAVSEGVTEPDERGLSNSLLVSLLLQLLFQADLARARLGRFYHDQKG